MGEGSKPHLNPLSIPWGKKPAPKPEEKAVVPAFLGVRNEAVRDNAAAERYITIIVQGLKSTPNAEYKLQWEEGSQLKHYLAKLKLVNVAITAAVRDADHLERGRLRMHHIPEEGARIVLGNPQLSSAMQFQRSSHDAADVALRMGGGAKFVDVPLHRRK